MSKKVVIIGTVGSSILGFRFPLIKELLAKGIEVYAFAIDYTDEDRKILNNIGVTSVDYSLSRSGLNPINEVKTIIDLTKKIKKIRPNIVFSYFTKPVIYGTLAAFFSKVENRYGMIEGLGYTFTDKPEGNSLTELFVRKVQIILLKIASIFLRKIIVLNDDDAQDIYKWTKHPNIEMLGGIGVDLDFFKFKEAIVDKIEFVFFSRLLKEKGVEYFIEAASLIKKKNRDVIFTIIGGYDHGNPNSLEPAVIDKLVSQGVIDYKGHVKNIEEHLADASVFVLPSYYREGVPRSTQEAMAIGRPVITTDSVGCRETVIDGYNGYLVKKYDVQDLTEKMEIFISDTSKIKSMGINSRNLAEKKFNIKEVNAKLLDILEIEQMLYLKQNEALAGLRPSDVGTSKSKTAPEGAADYYSDQA